MEAMNATDNQPKGKKMNRNQIMASLENPGEAECSRINDRLQQCNIREVRADGSTVQNTSVRTRLQLLRAMREDETVLRFEYRYNGEWVTAYCA